MDLPTPDSAIGGAAVADLLAHLQHLGWVSDKARITQLSSPGTGNMNRTLRVTLNNSQHPSLILKQAVPFVAKYPDIAAPADRDLSEAAFYQALLADARLAAQCPDLIGHDIDNHLLCFEDLGCQGDFTWLYAAAPLNAASSAQLEVALPLLLNWLSLLHQLPPPSSFPSNADMRQLNHEHIFVLPFQADNGLAEHPQVAQWQRDFCNRPAAMERIAALGRHYLGQQQPPDTAQTPPPGAGPSLLHGDFYPASWLLTESSTQPVQIIDSEFGFVGPPEFDLGVMSAHLTFAGWHQQPLAELLPKYAAPSGFSVTLAQQFCSVEIMRRLLGVAKLPLNADAATQIRWLEHAAAALD